MAWTAPKTMGNEPTLYSDWNTYVRDNLNYLKDSVGPKRATIWADEVTVTVGNALLVTHNIDANYYFSARQNISANGDTLTSSFTLLGGTYTLSLLCIKAANSGIVDVYLDNVKVISAIDLYVETTVNNAVIANSVTVVGTGYHVLKTVVNGKNVSSSSYNFDFTKIWFKPAAD